MSHSPLGLESLLALIKRYLLLQADNARLTVTQRLTLLLTGAAYVAVLFFLGMWLMFFAAVAGANFLGMVMPMGWAYLIITTLYIILIILCVANKRRMFLNPIARFLSRLILDAPKDADEKSAQAAVTEEIVTLTQTEQ